MPSSTLTTGAGLRTVITPASAATCRAALVAAGVSSSCTLSTREAPMTSAAARTSAALTAELARGTMVIELLASSSTTRATACG